MTLGRRQIYVNFVAMRSIVTAERVKSEKWETTEKAKQMRGWLFCGHIFFFTVNMDYALEDLKTLAMHCDDDEDVENMLP